MGCTQNILAPRYTLTVTFLDAFTNEPIEGYGIYGVDVVYPATISITGIARTTLVNRVSYSNKDGIASVTFHRYRKGSRYEFFYSSQDKKYFSPVNLNIGASDFDFQKDIKKTYKLDSKAQLRVKVNLKTPLKDGEKIRLILNSKYEININNKYVDENKTYELTGNFPTEIYKIYTINGVETRNSENIVLKPFVVNDYEFTY